MPGQPLRWGANVLFLHPSHVPSAERAAPGAARDGLEERRSPRTPRSPFRSPTGSGRGWGDGEGHQAGAAAQVLQPLQPCSLYPGCLADIPVVALIGAPTVSTALLW